VLAASVTAYPCNWSAWLVRGWAGHTRCCWLLQQTCIMPLMLLVQSSAWWNGLWAAWLTRWHCPKLHCLAASAFIYLSRWFERRTRAPCPVQALQAACGDVAVAGALSLPDHFMRTFFLASASVDSHHNAEALQHLQVCITGDARRAGRAARRSGWLRGVQAVPGAVHAWAWCLAWVLRRPKGPKGNSYLHQGHDSYMRELHHCRHCRPSSLGRMPSSSWRRCRTTTCR